METLMTIIVDVCKLNPLVKYIFKRKQCYVGSQILGLTENYTTPLATLSRKSE